MLYLMVILYILNGKAYLIQETFPNKEICMMVGTDRVSKLLLEQPGSEVVNGVCVSVEGDSAKKESK